MLVTGFPAGALAANCYVAAPAPGEECVIVDPGQDAQRGLEEILAAYRLKPAAVLLTHGHLDHMWSVVPVCGAKGIPAYIHPADRELLSDPAKGFPLGVGQELLGGMTFTEPDDVAELADGMTLRLAGIELTVNHAPGHTAGSVTFRLPPGASQGAGGTRGAGVAGIPGREVPVDAGEAGSGVLFSGDLLFAGSIGRTDLPGGDYETILASLARVCLPLPDEVAVLPGHGPRTTIGAERRSNPFLAGLAPARGPARGL
ncbi:MAG TPA: MBL fold metallo-hydrolase [Streptosporangiaceae bacterium]|nr:MBL fold metallo-hydrolase [Streptosporangiaceae bacterium]